MTIAARKGWRWRVCMRWFVASLVICSAAAHSADDDAAALELDAPAPADRPAGHAKGADDLRIYLELAAGRLFRRGGLRDAESSRLSLDYNQSFQMGSGWRLVLSNRLDHVEPVDSGQPSTVNSLREAYASWQGAEGSLVFDVGRLNLRNGPGYGFNPTDYFRDGALRVVTTSDPMALRENRLGTVMFRAQKLWPGGSMSAVLAPKIADAASDKAFSPDWGATNRVHRALLSFSGQWSERISYQALLYAEQGRKPQLGFNGTALLADAWVAHAELSSGREPDRLALVSGMATAQSNKNRLAAGVTYTMPFNLALTMEYGYNGAAPSRSAWDGVAAAQGAQTLGAYLLDVQRRQDSAARTSGLIYLTQKNLGLNKLDLSAFLRVNGQDYSRLVWAELRYHWDQLDLALQGYESLGTPLSEHGLVPDRRQVQLIGTWRF